MRKRIFLKWAKGFVVVLGIGLTACQREYNFSYEPESDQFALNVTYNSKVDLLWVVDNSSSMAQHQGRLSDQLESLVGTLNETKMDYHLGVITTSMGGQNPNGGRLTGEPKFISRTTKNSLNLMKQRFLIGQDGSDNEKGLDSLSASLDPLRLQTEYPQFLRDDSLLVIIFLTDENDHSINTTPQQVISQLDGLKKPFIDGSRSWIAHFIGVSAVSQNCTTFNRYSDPGTKYLEIVQESGGLNESICTADLRASLDKMKRKIVEKLTDFYLDRKPNLDTLRISFNGVVIPEDSENGWTYFQEGNFIRFNGTAIPKADDKIKVDYIPSETKS